MENDRETLRSIFTQSLTDGLAMISEDDKKRMSGRLSEMRSYAIGRHDYYDRLRTQLVTIAVALLPLTVGVVSLFYTASKGSQSIPLQMKIGVYMACSALVLAACYVMLKFVIGFSPRFAYRKVARILSWYYAYTPTYAFKREFFLTKTRATEARQKFAESLRDYSQNWLLMAKTIDGTIMEDLEQTFILFGLQKFRRDEAASFARVLATGVGLALVGGILIAAAIIWQ